MKTFEMFVQSSNFDIQDDREEALQRLLEENSPKTTKKSYIEQNRRLQMKLLCDAVAIIVFPIQTS